MTQRAGTPLCPGCLVKDMPEESALLQILWEYVASIPAEQRVEDGLYGQRLACCAACDALYGGLCRLCGCYVEARAAKALQRCPRVPPRWT